MILILWGWLGCVCYQDWSARRVSNHWVVAGALTGVLVLVFGVQPLGIGFTEALGAAVGSFSLLLVFYALGLMGAADVKFAAALGLWIGPWPLLWVWVGASLLAGMHALGLLAWRHRAGLPRTRKREIPYAAHMAAVTMGWLVWQHHMS